MALFGSMVGLISAMNLGPIPVWRASAPTQNVFGEFVKSTPVATNLDPVTVHTVTGRELENVPEAIRHTEVIRLYTTERLRVTDDGDEADRVQWDGRTFRVESSEDYGPHGDVYMSIAALEDSSEPTP